MRRDNAVCRAQRVRLACWTAVAAPIILLSLAGCGGGGGGDAANQPPPPSNSSNPPLISSFAPASGRVGTEVVVSGLNFAITAEGNTVLFGGAAATVTSASATELMVQVPMGAASGPMQITTAGGTATSNASFTVLPGTAPGANLQTRTFGPLVGTSGFTEIALAHNGVRFALVGQQIFAASTDARTWKRTKDFFDSAQDIASDGQIFVAVGGDPAVQTSMDGLTWTGGALPSSSSGISGANDVAVSSSTWVAVGQQGAIFSSPDAAAWTARISGTTRNLTDVTWTGDRFVAVGADGTVVTSVDGINWTLQVPPTTDSFTAVSGNLSLVVGVTFPDAVGTSPQLLTSGDGGVTWTPSATGLGTFNQIIYADGRFVAAGFNKTVTSIDAVMWTSSGQLPAVISSLVHANGQYVAVGSNGTTSGIMLTSPDGVSWSILQAAHDLKRIARSAADGRLVAVGFSDIVRTSTDNGTTWQFAPSGPLGSSHPFLDVVWSPSASAFVGHVQIAANQNAYTSIDGAAWTKGGSMPCNGAITASPALMVNVGSSLTGACISTSGDATTWTRVMSPSGSVMQGVFWTGSQFVGVGNSGLIATSPDGTAWTVRPSGVSAILNNGTASGSTLVAVGNSGTIVTSSDGGASWTTRTSGTSSTLRHALFTGSEFFVVGDRGTLLQSATGEHWTQQLTAYDAIDFGDIISVPGTSTLILAGESGLAAISPFATVSAAR